MADPQLQLVARRIRSFPDFPAPGVLFRCARRAGHMGPGDPRAPLGVGTRWPGPLSRAYSGAVGVPVGSAPGNRHAYAGTRPPSHPACACTPGTSRPS